MLMCYEVDVQKFPGLFNLNLMICGLLMEGPQRWVADDGSKWQGSAHSLEQCFACNTESIVSMTFASSENEAETGPWMTALRVIPYLQPSRMDPPSHPWSSSLAVDVVSPRAQLGG